MSNATTTNAPAGTAITGIDLVGCGISDVARSLAFYRDTLGLQPSYAAEGGAEFEFPNGETYGIWKPDGDEFPLGITVMFTVADAKAAVDAMNARGGTISEPFDSPVCKMAMGQDPDGNMFIIHERTVKNDPVAPPHVRTETSINGIDWAGFFVSNPPKSLEFYRDVLGLTPTVEIEGHGAEFTLADGTTFGFWHADNTPSKGGTAMFAVDDIHATVSALRERGVQATDPQDTGDCFMAFVADPDNTGIIIHQRK